MRSQLSHDALKPLCLPSHDVKNVVQRMAYIVTIKTLTKLLYWTYVGVWTGVSILLFRGFYFVTSSIVYRTVKRFMLVVYLLSLCKLVLCLDYIKVYCM
jgi:hypothetical protein